MLSHILSAAAVVATASAAFDPLSKNNVITYWGQGANQERLIETCKNSAYDIINVGFVNVFPDQGKGGWPGTNFGNACWGDVYQNEKGVDTDLLKTCPNIGEDVIACQQTYGKKIFLSLGGGRGDYYLNSAASARQFANFLWAAFGPVSASTPDVPRPWGDAAVDGFDFDIESLMDPPPAGRPNYQKAFYTDMIKRFKSALFPTDTSKPYYISGAPQCGIPDAHFTDVVANSWFDFLFIQFYNTDGCSARDGVKKINGKGNADISFLQWVASKSLNPNVRMSIGLPAAKKASRLGTYYLTPTEAQKLVKKFYKQKLFGGIMLWEATFAANNKPCQTDYGTWMKKILNGQANGKDIETTCPAKRDLSEYEEAPVAESTSSQCTSTVTLTRSTSSSVPAYGVTESASSPAAPVTTSMPAYSVSEAHGASSSSADVDFCTKTTTLIYRSGSETSTYVEPCPSSCTAKSSSSVGSAPAYTSSSAAPSGSASSPAASYPASPEESAPAESYPASPEQSSPAASYPASPEESSPTASYPASPEESSPAPSYPASEACGDEVTVTTTERSTVYITATEGAPSEDVTSMTTVQSTSTIYNTHHVWMTRYPSSSSAPGHGKPSSSASSPEVSSPSEYENSPVGGEGSSSSAPAQAYPSHGHHHGQQPSHSHGHTAASSAVAGPQGGEQGPQSTTTVINVVTVVPVPATSGVAAAAQPTGEGEAPYPYGPIGGNGTAPAGTASGTGAAWPTYAGPQQTGGAGAVGVNGILITGACLLGLVML